MKKITHFAGVVLFSLAYFIWLDFLISAGAVYRFILTRMGIANEIITYSMLTLVATYLLAEVCFWIREKKLQNTKSGAAR